MQPINENSKWTDNTCYQLLIFVPLGLHKLELLLSGILFTITLLVYAFEPRLEVFLEVMHGLILLLQCLDALVEGALFLFRFRIRPFSFHIVHEWENKLQKRNLK